MKKFNVILTVLIAAVSAFLLWLWFNLGFNTVDAPLDLILSVVWWAIVAVGIAFVVKTEKTRRESVRTVYVGDSEVDIETAANAGVDCISCTWGFRTREQLIASGAKVLVSDMAGLEESLK